jgi:ADP-ribose pyrophosphatase YjhB (NUDIX family)
MGELAGWTFCPRCRTELQGDALRLECPECGFVAYASSKPTAGALVADDEGRLLLARRAHEPFKGRWDIPGGFLEEGEHPLAGLRRELREETGLDGVFPTGLGVDGTPPGLIGYEEHPAGSKGLHMNFAFVADVATRTLTACDEYTAVRWVGDPVPVECPLNVRQLVRLALAAARTS